MSCSRLPCNCTCYVYAHALLWNTRAMLIQTRTFSDVRSTFARCAAQLKFHPNSINWIVNSTHCTHLCFHPPQMHTPYVMVTSMIRILIVKTGTFTTVTAPTSANTETARVASVQARCRHTSLPPPQKRAAVIIKGQWKRTFCWPQAHKRLTLTTTVRAGACQLQICAGSLMRVSVADHQTRVGESTRPTRSASRAHNTHAPAAKRQALRSRSKDAGTPALSCGSEREFVCPLHSYGHNMLAQAGSSGEAKRTIRHLPLAPVACSAPLVPNGFRNGAQRWKPLAKPCVICERDPKRLRKLGPKGSRARAKNMAVYNSQRYNVTTGLVCPLCSLSTPTNIFVHAGECFDVHIHECHSL